MNDHREGRTVVLFDETERGDHRVVRASLTNEGFQFSEDHVRPSLRDKGTYIQYNWSIVVPIEKCSTLALALQKAGGIESLPKNDPISNLLQKSSEHLTRTKCKFSDIHNFLTEHGVGWQLVSRRLDDGRDLPEDTHYCSDDVPKVTDKVYIPSELHVSHGVDDYKGGLTTISSVEMSKPDDGYIWIETAFYEAGKFRWDVLKKLQTDLATKFGTEPPKPTPDYRAEFNRWED